MPRVERTATIAGVKLASPGPGIWRIVGSEARIYGWRGTHGYRWRAPHSEATYQTLAGAIRSYIRHMNRRTCVGHTCEGS